MLILKETQIKTHNQNATDKNFNMIFAPKSIDCDGFALPRFMDLTANRVISRKETASKMLEAALTIQKSEQEAKSAHSFKEAIKNMMSSGPFSPNQEKSTEFIDHLRQLIVIYSRALKKHTINPNVEVNEDVRLLDSYIKKATMTGTLNFTLFGVSGLDEDMIKDSKAVSKDKCPQKIRSHPFLDGDNISPLIELIINIDGHRMFKSHAEYSSKTCFNSISNDWPIFKNKEIEFIVKSSESNVMVAHSSLTLLEFLDGQHHKIRIPLEPLGFVYCSVNYSVPLPRKAKIDRQKHIFIKGKKRLLINDFNQNYESWKNILKTYVTESSVKDGVPKIISTEENYIRAREIKESAEQNKSPELAVQWELPESKIGDKILNFKVSSFEDNDFKKASFILSGEFEKQFNLNRPTQQNLTIRSFKLISVLGFGHFGKVLLGQLVTNKKKYAIKAIPKLTIIESDDFEMLTIEKRILILSTEFKHPFLIHLISSFTTNEHACYAMEYMPAGDLLTNIQIQLFSKSRGTFYSACVLLGIEFLHSHGVMYRDLKLDNILLDSHGYVKIGDFGLAKSGMWHGVQTFTFCGTPEFICPELLFQKKYTRTGDWWAFGVLIFQMSTGESPFKGEEADDIFDSILNDNINVPHCVGHETKDIIFKLLNRDPNTRLGASADGAADVKRHPYFHGINFNNLLNKEIIPEYIPEFNHGNYTYIQPDMDDKKLVLPIPPRPLPPLTPDQDKFFKDFFYSSA
uniref:Serine/threonine-protein kinase N2 (Trinotate prediction) n=1 Tax=Myxobolus squamalis TaxID=59785 RepID=A0A6B2G2E1_MYXSQ